MDTITPDDLALYRTARSLTTKDHDQFLQWSFRTRKLVMPEASSFQPFTIDLDSTLTEVVGFQANDRGSLLRQYAWLNVTLPCGNERRYAVPDGIPHESEECLCGTVPYRHWFVRYDEARPATSEQSLYNQATTEDL